jgi:hypothetical protein
MAETLAGTIAASKCQSGDAGTTPDLSRLAGFIGEKPNHIFFKEKRALQP